MAGAIACEISTAERKHVGFILIQIFLLGLSLSASLDIIVPSLIGGDPWYHYGFATKILINHFVPDGYIYSTMPFFHLTTAVTSILSTLPYKFSTMLSVSFVQILIESLFIFLITYFLFKNHRIGLLSSLLVIIGDQNIIRSIAPIPNSFGYVFILITLYLIFTRYNDKNKLGTGIIIALCMAPLIFVHSLPALIMTLFLFVIWISFYYLREFSLQKIQYLSFFIPLGFFIAMLSWWYLMGTQTKDVTRILAEALNYDVTAYSPIPDIVANATIINSNEVLFVNLGLYLFISMSLIGFFYMISRKGNNFTFYFALMSIIPVIAYILLYFFVGFVFTKTYNILFDRWINLIQIVMCVPLAFSIYLIGTYKIRGTNQLSLFFGGFVILLSVLMIMTPTGSPDSHALTPSKQYWSYYTESEMSGNNFFAYKSKGVISSDRDHAVAPGSSIFNNVYGINFDRLHMLDFEIQSGIFEHDNSVKIFRTKRITEFQRVGVFSPKIQPDLDTYLSINGFNKIYESPTMIGYTG